MAKAKIEEYPKALYDKTGKVKVVQDAAEEKALGKGWSETPGKAAK